MDDVRDFLVYDVRDFFYFFFLKKEDINEDDEHCSSNSGIV
jgi:hypothetical protein